MKSLARRTSLRVMTKSRNHDLEHWLGFGSLGPDSMTPYQALGLETFKKRNSNILEGWGMRYPNVKSWPPIYWSKTRRRWVWVEITQENYIAYFALCDALMVARGISVNG